MLANMTVADLLRPSEKKRAGFYDLALILGGSVLIGLSFSLREDEKIRVPSKPVRVTPIRERPGEARYAVNFTDLSEEDRRALRWLAEYR